MNPWKSVIDWLRPRPKPPPPAPSGLASALLEATNAARARAGRPPYQPDPRLDAAAAQHAADMAGSGIMSHAGFPGRLTSAGYSYSAAAENVAAGQETAEQVVATWMESVPHRANLLGPYLHMGGSGAMRASNNTWFWCADYGSP